MSFAGKIKKTTDKMTVILTLLWILLKQKTLGFIVDNHKKT
jgi:hypothetical protein